MGYMIRESSGSGNFPSLMKAFVHDGKQVFMLSECILRDILDLASALGITPESH